MIKHWFERQVVYHDRKYFCLDHKPKSIEMPIPQFWMPKTVGCHTCHICKKPGFYIKK